MNMTSMAATGSDILVVEDEAVVAIELQVLLEDMGYRVCGVADNGAQAIALAREHRPALVLMDIVIRGPLDGIETARHLQRGLAIPVLFLTAYSDDATVARAAQTAPYGYLTKPFQERELRAMIEVALVKAGLERQLRESERWFTSTLRCVADGVVASDQSGLVRFMNAAAESLTGWTAEDALGRPIAEVVQLQDPILLDGRSRVAMASPLIRALHEDRVVGIEFGSRLMSRDGRSRPIDDSAAPIRDDEGRVLGAVMAFRDVSERLDFEQSLRASEQRFRSAFDFAPVGMALVAIDGRFLQLNSAVCTLLGREEAALLEQHLIEVTHPGDAMVEREQALALLASESVSAQYEKRLRHADGRDIWVLASVTLMRRDGEALCFLYQFHDLTERKLAESQLAHLAHFDPLTGLANRARLRDEAEHMIVTAHRQRESLAVLFLDLDMFKQVNDTMGHEAGDLLLQEVARRLRDGVRETDCVARLGGDEFVIVLANPNGGEQVAHVAEKLRARVSASIPVGGRELHVGVSIGAAMYPEDGEDVNTLLRCADSALYHAKEQGRGNLQFYRPELTLRIAERLDMELALRFAIENGEFELHYQPLITLADGAVIGAEALIRWRHPTRGLLAPDTFIPVAEDSGLIEPIGDWVIATACRAAASWPAVDGRLLEVAVNVSPRQFRSTDLIATLHAQLGASGLDPMRLCLEITEQALLRDTDLTQATLARLRTMGVRVAIDDFGIGYSSLGYLRRFAPDVLKIDRSFVQDVTDDRGDAAIVSAVVAMSRRLGLRTVAEGVETEAQRAFLVAEGCETAQGYLYSKPLPAGDFAAWLAARSSAVVATASAK